MIRCSTFFIIVQRVFISTPLYGSEIAIDSQVGIKLNPEAIEKKLSEQIDPVRFMVSSLPDAQLGEKVVLIVEEKLNLSTSFDQLDKYEKPKMVIENHPFTLTDSGKIDRIKTRNSLKEIHNEN